MNDVIRISEFKSPAQHSDLCIWDLVVLQGKVTEKTKMQKPLDNGNLLFSFLWLNPETFVQSFCVGK